MYVCWQARMISLHACREEYRVTDEEPPAGAGEINAGTPPSRIPSATSVVPACLPRYLLSP